MKDLLMYLKTAAVRGDPGPQSRLTACLTFPGRRGADTRTAGGVSPMALITMNLFVDFLFVSSRFLQQLSACLP